MQAAYECPGVCLYNGNALDVLRTLPDESVNCCVTSPPYWGLRDYGTGKWDGGDPNCPHRVGGQVQDNKAKGAIVAGVRPGVDASRCLDCGAIRTDNQIGLEPTPGEFVEKLVAIFTEVSRVLTADGTFWLNLGDSYASSPPGNKTKGVSDRYTLHGVMSDNYRDTLSKSVQTKRNTVCAGLKPKDLVGIPWRVAFALQESGWWLRSDIIWAKPSPMPESVEDRPTRSHEYIFLLAKSQKYYYDFEAIKEPSVAGHGSGNGYKREARLTYSDDNGPRGSDKPWQPSSAKNSAMDPNHSGRRMVENVAKARAAGADHDNPFGDTRNKRDVWTINTQPFPDAHFAVFPEDLVRPCILAGCPKGGTVLDPFAGSGTTLKVARDLGCNAVGIELNPEYIEIAKRRLAQDVLAF